MKWPWEGNYVFHQHGMPEDRGAMGTLTLPCPHLT